MTSQEFLATLDSLDNVNPQWKTLEAWLQKGERDKLVEIARGCADLSPQQWQRRSIRDRIAELFALKPHRENIAAVVEIASFSPRRAPVLAEMLALNQGVPSLTALLETAESREANREYLAFLAQELSLSGVDLTQTGARLLWEELHARGDELAVLPLYRLDCETGLNAYRRSHSLGSSSSGGSPGGMGLKLATSDGGETPAVRKIDCDTTRIASAVANWCQESNGQVEAACFEFQIPIGEFGAQTLAHLNLESVSGSPLQGSSPLGLLSMDFENALETLFAAAANGGAYNAGEYGARGRLRAWQSAAAMCGSAAQNPVEILETAQNCRWFEFEVHNAWFYHVAWDLGLVCLREDGKTVATLSATDQD